MPALVHVGAERSGAGAIGAALYCGPGIQCCDGQL
jgi:hypothetical protein